MDKILFSELRWIFIYCLLKMEDYYNCSMLKLLIILCIGILCQTHVYLYLGQFVASGPL